MFSARLLKVFDPAIQVLSIFIKYVDLKNFVFFFDNPATRKCIVEDLEQASRKRCFSLDFIRARRKATQIQPRSGSPSEGGV
jgi:hypothetical protein